jgi:hypothetical protein
MIRSSLLSVALVIAACGGTSSAPAEHASSSDPWVSLPSPDLDDTIAIDRESGVTSASEFDQFSSVFFNESLEGLALNSIEEHMMERIGLDPNDSDDYKLLAFVIRGFHYRFYALEEDGPERDLGIYLYNLNGVQVGHGIPVLDARELEDLDAELVGAALHEVFDPIRESGEAVAIVGFSDSRAHESSLRSIFINAFAEDVVYATDGSVHITAAETRSGPLAVVSHPIRDLTRFDISFEGIRDGRSWRIEQNYLPLTVSQSHD